MDWLCAGKILNLPEREIHRTRAQRMEKAVRTHVGTFKHNDGVNKLQAEFSRNFQAFMEGMLQGRILSARPDHAHTMQAGCKHCCCSAAQALFRARVIHVAWQCTLAECLSGTSHISHKFSSRRAAFEITKCMCQCLRRLFMDTQGWKSFTRAL